MMFRFSQALSTLTGSTCQRVQQTHQHQLLLSAEIAKVSVIMRAFTVAANSIHDGSHKLQLMFLISPKDKDLMLCHLYDVTARTLTIKAHLYDMTPT